MNRAAHDKHVERQPSQRVLVWPGRISHPLLLTCPTALRTFTAVRQPMNASSGRLREELLTTLTMLIFSGDSPADPVGEGQDGENGVDPTVGYVQ